MARLRAAEAAAATLPHRSDFRGWQRPIAGRGEELRDVFTEWSDYSNPIEPSAKGGEKTARAIRNWLMGDS